MKNELFEWWDEAHTENKNIFEENKNNNETKKSKNNNNIIKKGGTKFENKKNS